jgi:streptogramin lyase
MRRRTLLTSALAVPAGAAGLSVAGPAAAAPPVQFPSTINLPNGWQPEGIAIGCGTSFYVGSLVDGAIYRGDLRTGQGSRFVLGHTGGQAVGLEIDASDRVWACGGGTGGAIVYDGRTGAKLAEYAFGGTFVNDAVATSTAVYFTDSYQPFLYVVPLGSGGRLPDQSAVRKLTLTGGLGDVSGFNNGIEVTPHGELLVVQMLAGRLYRCDPATGASVQVDLHGGSVLDGDGMVRRGQTLYVVRNSDNIIAKFALSPDVTSATLVRNIEDSRFQVPATMALFGPYIYAVNARFDLENPTPDTTYTVVRVNA